MDEIDNRGFLDYNSGSCFSELCLSVFRVAWLLPNELRRWLGVLCFYGLFIGVPEGWMVLWLIIRGLESRLEIWMRCSCQGVLVLVKGLIYRIYLLWFFGQLVIEMAEYWLCGMLIIGVDICKNNSCCTFVNSWAGVFLVYFSLLFAVVLYLIWCFWKLFCFSWKSLYLKWLFNVLSHCLLFSALFCVFVL